MKPWMPLLLALALLGACSPVASKPDSAAQTAHSDQAAPRLPEFSAPSAAEAEAAALGYTPASAKQTLYFTVGGRPAEQAAAGGFYREILGRTADGRLVVQDFYQDIAKRQTAPFVLSAGAEPKDFSTDVMDSKGVWYRPDGSLFYLQDYRNGKETGPATYYQDGLPLMQTHNMGSRSLFFYNDGKLMAELLVKNPESADIEQTLTLFRTDGSAILRVLTRGSEAVSTEAWDAAGQAAPMEATRMESTPLLDRVEELQTNFAHTVNFVMGEPEAASPAR
ncbi:MAG: hypothetical protein Q4A62_04310 [Eikenella sp.]|nr:hypothetical protein [Eikenella sp.]